MPLWKLYSSDTYDIVEGSFSTSYFGWLFYLGIRSALALMPTKPAPAFSLTCVREAINFSFFIYYIISLFQIGLSLF